MSQLFDKSLFLRVHECPCCHQRHERLMDETRQCFRCDACGVAFILDEDGQPVECEVEPKLKRHHNTISAMEPAESDPRDDRQCRQDARCRNRHRQMAKYQRLERLFGPSLNQLSYREQIELAAEVSPELARHVRRNGVNTKMLRWPLLQHLSEPK